MIHTAAMMDEKLTRYEINSQIRALNSAQGMQG